MQHRKEINDQLLRWIKAKVKTEYPQDISLVCVYGSAVNGTMNAKSDLDCYFLPKTERGYELATTFILEGVGYDIYPVSWQRLEDIANLRSGMQPLVGDAQILYCATEEDAMRFAALREMLRQNLQSQSYTREMTGERCREAASLLAALEISEQLPLARKLAGRLIVTLADAIALYHRDYFHFGLKRQYADLLSGIPGIPEHLARGYRNVIEGESVPEVIHRAKIFFTEVCNHIGIAPVPPPVRPMAPIEAATPNGPALAALYQEICSTFNKIYVCRETGDSVLAFLSAVTLQWDLDDALSLGCPRYDLLSAYHPQALHRLADTARQIEQNLIRCILDNGGTLRSYSCFADFTSANPPYIS